MAESDRQVPLEYETPLPARPHRLAGWTFLDVLLALSVLLVVSVPLAFIVVILVGYLA